MVSDCAKATEAVATSSRIASRRTEIFAVEARCAPNPEAALPRTWERPNFTVAEPCGEQLDKDGAWIDLTEKIAHPHSSGNRFILDERLIILDRTCPTQMNRLPTGLDWTSPSKFRLGMAYEMQRFRYALAHSSSLQTTPVYRKRACLAPRRHNRRVGAARVRRMMRNLVRYCR
jgi:hypothetical protein